MLPCQRRGMGEQFGRDGVVFAVQVIDDVCQVCGIPVDDSRNDEVQTAQELAVRRIGHRR